MLSAVRRSTYYGFQGPNRRWKASLAQGDRAGPRALRESRDSFSPALARAAPERIPTGPAPGVAPLRPPRSSQPGTMCLAPARDLRRHMWGRSEFLGSEDVCSAHV